MFIAMTTNDGTHESSDFVLHCRLLVVRDVEDGWYGESCDAAPGYM